ncbi:MAG: F0F1 ATP synthase subunit gamma [Anaerolineae bacterium]|nr:F0F1 ATP synthase subunit gamma [Anaerolineae bacterium]
MAGREGIEGIKARLNNIRTVEPILGAMRTISLGSWQSALKRKERVLAYAQRVLQLLPSLLPHLAAGRRHPRAPSASAAPVVLVVIGSERGLCGAFNSVLAQHVDRELVRLASEQVAVELYALGSRTVRALSRLGHEVAWSASLPMAALPSSAFADELTRALLGRYEAHEVDAVYVAHNVYRHSTLYQPAIVQLIPPPLPAQTEGGAPWPPPYIDTDPTALFVQLVVQWTTTEMYRLLLDSAAAEHSARYQLMEGATQNSARLIEELTLALQAARQQAITAEMQELAAGAGLIGGEEP